MKQEAAFQWLKTGLLIAGFTVIYAGALMWPAGATALIFNGDCGLARTASEAASCNSGMLRVMLIIYGIGALLYPFILRFFLLNQARLRERKRDANENGRDQV